MCRIVSEFYFRYLSIRKKNDEPIRSRVKIMKVHAGKQKNQRLLAASDKIIATTMGIREITKSRLSTEPGCEERNRPIKKSARKRTERIIIGYKSTAQVSGKLYFEKNI